MPVPRKHDDELRTEVQEVLYTDWLDAREQAMAWGKRAGELRHQLEEQLGDSTGGTIHNRLVVTYRYKESFATAALVRDYPELTRHYMRQRLVEELDVDLFGKTHADILRKYQAREFRVSGQGEVAPDAE